MEVKEIIKKYLEENGYDGLYSEDCGCDLELGLFPCGLANVEQCKAGHYIKCDPETCPAEGRCEWHIGENERR